MHGLVNQQSGESPALVPASLLSWVSSSASLHTAVRCVTWANCPLGKRLSPATQTDWGPWDMIWMGWWPLSACAWVAPQKPAPVLPPSLARMPHPLLTPVQCWFWRRPSWEKSATEAARFLVAAYDHLNSCSHSLSPPQPYTRSGMNTTRKGQNPGLNMSRAPT